MCTVTFVPSGTGVIITSNRDESALRPWAAMPAWEARRNSRIFFPKDGLAGGTWIGVQEGGPVMVLLNGAFVRHEHRPPYRRSRGLVFLDILDAPHPREALEAIALEGIEPFTVLLWMASSFTEMRWDGSRRYLKPLDASQPGIWSSASLYDPEVVQKREAWFAAWRNDHPVPTVEELKLFHLFTGDGDPENDLLMNRGGGLRTISIASIGWQPEKAVFGYSDLLSGTQSETEIPFIKRTV